MIRNSDFLRRIEAAAYESVRNSNPGVVRVRNQSQEDIDRCVQALVRALAARAGRSRTAQRRQQQQQAHVQHQENTHGLDMEWDAQ